MVFLTAPTLVRPGTFTFYETLPIKHKRIDFTLSNKKPSPDTRKVYQGIQSPLNMLIHLRRNYRANAYDTLAVRMYPKEEFEDNLGKSLYAFAIDGDSCNSSEEVYICLFAPYALDGETKLTVRVFAAEVTDKEAKDLKRQDAEREQERDSLRDL